MVNTVLVSIDLKQTNKQIKPTTKDSLRKMIVTCSFTLHHLLVWLQLILFVAVAAYPSVLARSRSRMEPHNQRLS